MENLFYEAEKLEKLGENATAFDKYSRFIEQASLSLENEPHKDSSSLRSKLALAYNNRGYLRYLRVDFDEAVEDYSQGLEMYDRLYVGYYNRGLIHYRLGRFQLAVKDLESCLKLQPDFPPAVQCYNQSVMDLEKQKQNQPQ